MAETTPHTTEEFDLTQRLLEANQAFLQEKVSLGLGHMTAEQLVQWEADAISQDS